jgi:hypothetical protein
MPIKDKSLYPKNWKEIRAQILERAGHRCEECSLPNYCWILRHKDGRNWPPNGWKNDSAMTEGIGGEWIPEIFENEDDAKLIKIVLTIAHLDHNPQNNDPSNLKALCQMHHLRHDKDHHAKNAAKTRALKMRQQLKNSGQLALFND